MLRERFNAVDPSTLSKEWRARGGSNQKFLTITTRTLVPPLNPSDGTQPVLIGTKRLVLPYQLTYEAGDRELPARATHNHDRPLGHSEGART